MLEAKEYYMAAQKDPYAFYCLGKLLEEGKDPDCDGVPDLKKAYEMYQIAHQQGCEAASTRIAEMLV